MKRVSSFYARAHLSQLLSEVEQEQRTILIQRRGRDVAVLAPCRGIAELGGCDSRERILAGLQQIRAAQRGSRAHGTAKDLIADGREP